MTTRGVLVLLALVGFLKISHSLFEQCNHVLNLKAGQKMYINSPYYPGLYPVGTSCRYTVKAPEDYQLNFKCDIQINTPPAASRCLNEIFYFNREGGELLSGSEYFCGSGSMERKSFLNRAVISYISKPQAQLRTTTSTTTTRAPSTVSTTATTTTTATTSTTTTTTTHNPNEVSVDEVALTNTQDPTSGYHSTVADIGVSNSMAYVIGLLANNWNGVTVTAAETPDNDTNNNSAWNDFLPSILWRNATILENVKTVKRKARIVAPLDGHSGSGGGLFSCLVEVVDPVCDCGWSTITKVAGDSLVAGINEFPSMAGVKTVRYNKIFCGASIIHHRYLLSAAHCFSTPETSRPDQIWVVVGEHDISTVLESLNTRSYNIENIILHEGFRTTSSGVRNDIALLRTTLAIEWNRSVGPACLPFRSVTGTDGGRKLPKAGQRVDAAGWGTTSFGGPQSSKLLKTSLDVITNDQCRQALTTLPPSIFCTYTPGRDTCQYDSGGALYLRSERLYAVGIVSYGTACATRLPSVNTKVASFVKWIKSKTPEARYCIK